MYPGSEFKVEGRGRTATEAFEDAKVELKGAYAVEKSAWDNHVRRMKHSNDKKYDEFVDEMNTATNTVNTLLKIK